MDMIAPYTGPSPGAAKPGNLYADLGSRTLWLGVEAAVDPNQAVLISDIVGLESQIDDALAEAKAYTDTRILTRAPTVHTHTASQITDFASAVAAVVAALPGANWVHGMILQYTGSLADIGVGLLAGWSLCDGSNGTPDLRDKFIVGAGNKVIGATSAGGITTDGSQGGHTHTVNPTAITIAQMPSHDHTPGTGGESVDHQHLVQGQTDAQGLHNHNNSGYSNILLPIDNTRTAQGFDVSTGEARIDVSAPMANAGNHAHNINFWSGGRNQGHTHAIYAQGGSQGHIHTLVGGGGVHSHTITGAQIREAVPYYALAFIMKL